MPKLNKLPSHLVTLAGSENRIGGEREGKEREGGTKEEKVVRLGMKRR